MSETADHPLSLARKNLERHFRSFDDAYESLQQYSDPEEAVTLLKDPWTATGLKKQLKIADVNWVNSFLAAGGLDALWSVLETCTSDGLVIRTTAILRCMDAIKTLLSFHTALDLLVTRAGSMKYIDRLLTGVFICIFTKMYLY